MELKLVSIKKPANENVIIGQRERKKFFGRLGINFEIRNSKYEARNNIKI